MESVRACLAGHDDLLDGFRAFLPEVRSNRDPRLARLARRDRPVVTPTRFARVRTRGLTRDGRRSRAQGYARRRARGRGCAEARGGASARRERERGWTTNQRRGTRASCVAPRRVRASIARDVDGDHRARGEREREAAEAAEVSCGGVFLSHEPSFRSCPTDRIPIRIRRSGTRRRRRRRRRRNGDGDARQGG